MHARLVHHTSMAYKFLSISLSLFNGGGARPPSEIINHTNQVLLSNIASFVCVRACFAVCVAFIFRCAPSRTNAEPSLAPVFSWACGFSSSGYGYSMIPETIDHLSIRQHSGGKKCTAAVVVDVVVVVVRRVADCCRLSRARAPRNVCV